MEGGVQTLWHTSKPTEALLRVLHRHQAFLGFREGWLLSAERGVPHHEKSAGKVMLTLLSQVLSAALKALKGHNFSSLCLLVVMG